MKKEKGICILSSCFCREEAERKREGVALYCSSSSLPCKEKGKITCALVYLILYRNSSMWFLVIIFEVNGKEKERGTAKERERGKEKKQNKEKRKRLKEEK